MPITRFGRTSTTVPHGDELTIYVKFTSDVVTEFKLLSFKESSND